MSNQILQEIARLDGVGKKVARIAIVVILFWIGALKFFTYEADGIVPFVANSPFMSFFYRHPGDYKRHVGKEGEWNAADHQWQMENNTYGFADGLGVFLIVVAVMVAMHPFTPFLSMIGSMLVFLLTVGTLSFLVTTPECWIAHRTEASGFPFLSGRGRLVIKDIALLAASIITMSESAALVLKRQASHPITS